MNKTYCFKIAVIVMLALAPGLCTGSDGLPGKTMDETGLRQQVTLEWESRLRNDWSSIYDLTTREYKNTKGKEAFGTGSNTAVKKYAINSIEIDFERETADVKVDYTTVNKGFEFAFVSHERWVWEKNQWYLVPLN